MARRGRSTDDASDRADTDPPSLNSPFRNLRKEWKHRPAPAPAVPTNSTPTKLEASPSTARAAPEPAVFAGARAGAAPLPGGPPTGTEGPAPACGGPGPVSEEAEALAALSDLVAGVAHFDITDTREYVEGVVVGLDPRIARRLR